MTVTMDSAGRIVIPKQLRDQLALRPGEELEIRNAGGKIEIEPQYEDCEIVVDDHGFPVLRSKGGQPKRTLTNEEVRASIREMREARGRI